MEPVPQRIVEISTIRATVVELATMKRKIYSVLYWFAGVTIGLGAFGHGIGGGRVLRAGLATAALDPNIVGVLWIVWYYVSGAMLLFGVAIVWSWFAARRGGRDVLIVPAMIGVLYAIFGAAALLYGRDPFWLLFLVQGVLLLGSSLGLRQAS